MESQSRTLFKTLSWRIFATLTTSVIVWKFTGKPELGLSVATVDCAVKLFTYYLHERIWNSVKFGYQPVSAAKIGESTKANIPSAVTT
ncbi:hypothetical protein BH10CYA1_BH10CYA1_39810 [soil metagenome]